MKFLLNGQEIEEEIGDNTPLGIALSDVQSQNIADNEVIAAIWVDGEQLTAELLSQWKDRPVRDFLETRIDAPKKNKLAADSLRILAEGLADSNSERETIVDSLGKGRSDEALKGLPDYLQIWQALQQSISSLARLLKIDLDCLEIYSTSDPDDPEKSFLLADHIKTLSEKLVDMKQALESEDFVFLSDIINYEFESLTKTWQSLLEELADRFEHED
ncbi:MAG: hypothetical protein IID32_09845 [Planctomycetes bacterium]|nr:hypothetical protein [Planctomycetota bacterium]